MSTYQEDKRTTQSSLMSKQQAPGASRADPTDEVNIVKPNKKSTRKTTLRHTIDKTKEELYATTKDADIKEIKEHVIKTLQETIHMEDIE